MSIASLDTGLSWAWPRARSRGWPRTGRTAATLVWAAALLGGAEAGLRARAWWRYGTVGPVAEVYEVDAQNGRRLRAGARVDGSSRQVSVNRWGFRGAEVPREKPAGSVRIAAIGDSTTFGMEAASDESVWVARLASRLREAPSTPHVDAINGAVPGYTLAMSAARLERDIAPFDPDIVIVLQTATDIAAHSRRQFARRDTAATEESALGRLLEEHSLLFNVVRQNAAPFLARWMPAGRHDRLDDRGVREYAEQLTRLVGSCQGDGRRAILCTTPRSFGDATSAGDQYALAGTALMNNPALSLDGLNDAYDRYNEAARDVARQTGAALVDLDRLVPRGDTYFVDATHLNDAGHAQVAEHAARAVLADLLGEYAAIAGPVASERSTLTPTLSLPGRGGPWVPSARPSLLPVQAATSGEPIPLPAGSSSDCSLPSGGGSD